MYISNSVASPVEHEADVIARLLTLQGASVLELGCGKAEKTYLIAQKAASILALEVDETQLAIHKTSTAGKNIRFEHGGAENIPASNASFDLVLMFKSLHHVPAELMEIAFSEIHRVLKPGGMVYISEPVFAGEFNEILRLFHDEQTVRELAFAAVKNAVSSGQFSLVQQTFFSQPIHFENFDQLEQQVIKVTHTDHRLSATLLDDVRSAFEKHMTPTGADFQMPIRVDLLRKS
jgi:ubiquinone/menaquinone biosynthesis C-methylase UbiE